MVVSPNEILKKVTIEEKRKISNLEKELDRVIESNFRHGKCYASYSIPENITKIAINIVIGMYQEAGWKVKYVSDQRDGDYLHFIPAGRLEGRI